MMTSLPHRQLWDLIPWVVNGTAAPGEREAVERHLAECADCRDEHAFQCLLHAGMRQASTVPDSRPQAALERLLTKLDAESVALPEVTGLAQVTRRHRARRSRQVLTAVLVAQTLALSLMGAVLLARAWSPMAPTFHTLTRAPATPERATIRLVPSPALRMGELHALLADAGVVIVQSNRDGSILGLAPATLADHPDEHAQQTAAIARLRADPRVLLAEPVAEAASNAH
jgi:putative zinc finger protein